VGWIKTKPDDHRYFRHKTKAHKRIPLSSLLIKANIGNLLKIFMLWSPRRHVFKSLQNFNWNSADQFRLRVSDGFGPFLLGKWLSMLNSCVMKMAVCSVPAPCSLIEVYRRFRGACCLHHRSKHLRNVGKLLPDYTALQPRRQPPSYSLP
jgi:hypothetical protein